MDTLCAKMGWGTTLNDEPSGNPEEVFQIQLPAVSQFGSFRDECINNAKEVMCMAKALGKRPMLYLSGGMDSHSMFWSFIEAGIPHEDFDVMIYHTHMNGVNLNDQDVAWAMELINRFPLINVITEPIHLNDKGKGWDQNRYTEYHIRADLGLYLRRVVADRYAHSHMPVQVGDLCVFGYIPEIEPDNLCAIFKPFNPSTQMFRIDQTGVSCFHQMRPQSMQAYFNAVFLKTQQLPIKQMYPHFKQLEDMAYKAVRKGGVKFYEYLIKPLVFGQEWPEMTCHPKQTGFEKGPDFTVDPISIELTTIQLHRSVVVPLRKLVAYAGSTTRNYTSNWRPCLHLEVFKR